MGFVHSVHKFSNPHFATSSPTVAPQIGAYIRLYKRKSADWKKLISDFSDPRFSYRDRLTKGRRSLTMRLDQNLRIKSFFRQNEPAPPISYVLIRNQILVPMQNNDLNPERLLNKGNRENNRETVITLSTIVLNSHNFLLWTVTSREHDKS